MTTAYDALTKALQEFMKHEAAASKALPELDHAYDLAANALRDSLGEQNAAASGMTGASCAPVPCAGGFWEANGEWNKPSEARCSVCKLPPAVHSHRHGLPTASGPYTCPFDACHYPATCREAGVCAAVGAASGAAKVPEGWKLVPVEPTPEMARDGHWRWRNWEGYVVTREQAIDIYRVMLAASPSPSGDEESKR